MVPPISGRSAATDVPSYISARAANALISENRPTRIQAETLLVLNRLLDELLLLILSSARSLATDRIKTDGMLRVLGNNLLAKDAVLEAELELRSYLDGKRAEGAKIPLGLMATSRLDGTEDFPVTSAYNALRIRCQYYSTLGDREDDSAGTDQNIMSNDGRPIATITPGVAIYVTALLEFVGEHVLQNVARVIERDNSDEASLYDLKAALAEDELLAGLFNKMAIKAEVERRIEISHGRRNRRLNGSGLPDDLGKGGKGEARAVKPWQVPTENELDEAAAPARFSARRASVQPVARGSRQDSHHERASSSGHSYTQGVLESSESVSHSSTNPSLSTAATSVTGSGSIGPAGSIDGRSGMSRRQSSDKGWTGVFGQMKRRNSQRQSSDVASGSFGRTLSPSDALASQNDESALEPEDDFEALMLSGQTMKVSLTPNRLRTIEVAKQEADAKMNARRRPGAMVSPLRDDFAGAPSSWSTHPERKFGSQPPSSYRSPSPALVSPKYNGSGAGDDDLESVGHASTSAASRKMQPREGQVDRGTSSQDMVDFLRSAPSHDTTSSHGSLRLSESGSDGSRKVGVSNRVRNLFGRKASVNGKDVLSSPPRASVSSMRDDAQSTSGQISPSGGSSIVSHAEHARSSSPLMAGSMGRRTTVGQHADPAMSGEAARRGPSFHASRPSSSAGSVASPVQVTVTNTVPGVDQPALAATSAAGATPTDARSRAGTARADSQSTIDDRRSINERQGRASPALVGLYEETKQPRPRTPPSPRARQRQDELPSRKVPWGYNRYSASGHGRAEGDSSGTPTSDKRRSIGYQSSNGHGGASYRTTRASTENGDVPGHAQLDESSVTHGAGGGHNVSGRTPTLFYTHNGRRGSGAQSSLAASRDSSSFMAHQRPPSHVILMLAELEKQMRDCSSVEECRALIGRALSGSATGAGNGPTANGTSDLHETGSSVHHGSIADIPDEESSVHGAHSSSLSREASAGTDRPQARYAAADAPRRPADELEATRVAAPTSLEACDQNLVVAWLLGGDEVPSFHADPPSPMQREADSAADERKSGINGGKSPRGPYTAVTSKARMGSVVSLASNYRDASEGAEIDEEQ
ncbi:uncharacterized protein PSFLO_07751 [Pseudozyma flocculosa]|uniref:Uncharacterized protein n=1 Tax=Pseudozyma flocculosa TaxID=84751 RepID=A0A5C3FD35_9BASI|nr:uncharacterized protein PSFLO_07751 [Pseudozyma flocculosa]